MKYLYPFRYRRTGCSRILLFTGSERKHFTYEVSASMAADHTLQRKDKILSNKENTIEVVLQTEKKRNKMCFTALIVDTELDAMITKKQSLKRKCSSEIIIAIASP